MYTRKATLIVLAALGYSLAAAQPSKPVASDSRDAALAYLGTANYIVGQLGGACLTTLGRSESAQQFVAAWKQRNAKYVNAAGMYMEQRLQEAYRTGGEEKRTAVLQEVSSVARSNGDAVVRDWLQGGTKKEACRRAVGQVEAGALDVSVRTPMYRELESLASWAQQ